LVKSWMAHVETAVGLFVFFFFLQASAGQPADESAGDVLWTYNCGYSRVSITDDDALIAVGRATVQGGDVYLFNTSGNLLWTSQVGGGVRSISFSPIGSILP